MDAEQARKKADRAAVAGFAIGVVLGIAGMVLFAPGDHTAALDDVPFLGACAVALVLPLVLAVAMRRQKIKERASGSDGI